MYARLVLMSKRLVLLMENVSVRSHRKSLVPMADVKVVRWMDAVHVWLAYLLSAINVWIAKPLWRMGSVPVLRDIR